MNLIRTIQLRPALLIAALAVLLTTAPAAQAIPVTRGGVVVGQATATIATGNGIAIVNPTLTGFTPPVAGERYRVKVKLRYGCGGMLRTVSSQGRVVRLHATGSVNLWSFLSECNGSIGSTEAWLIVSRVSTGEIVGRARLFSAG